MLRRAGARKVVVHDHTSGARSVPTGMRRVVKRLLVSVPGLAADTVVAVSEYVARRQHDVNLLPADRVRLVWNGVGAPDDNIARVPSVHEMLHLGPSTTVIGATCRATPEKGVDVLFDAFDHIFEHWEGPLAPVLAYAGSGPDFERLAAKRERLRSARNIYMLGYVPNAAEVMRSASVCAVPSLWQDAFPLSVLESMVRGHAVVASSVGGVPEMLEQGESGLLVPPGDSSALADALLRVLRDGRLAASLGKSARHRALRRFPIVGQTIGMIEAVEDVLPGAGDALAVLRKGLTAELDALDRFDHAAVRLPATLRHVGDYAPGV
jgi:glycosyltransferase involved in cell wall biosynthesis